MEENNLIDLLKIIEEKHHKLDYNYDGINIKVNNKELVISGKQYDLVELANYIIKVALSNNERDHLHLDNLTIINEDSNIEELIIEKE